MKHHPVCGTTYMEDCECETVTQTTPDPMPQPRSPNGETVMDEFEKLILESATPNPERDEEVVYAAMSWRHANWCMLLDPEEPRDRCTCGLDDYLAARVSQSVRATFETWWESERLNPSINYSAAFEAGYRAALRGDKFTKEKP